MTTPTTVLAELGTTKLPRRRIHALRSAAVLGLSFALHLPAAATTTSAGTQQRAWSFDVFLDDRPIGTHRFEITDAGSQRHVSSDASFDIKLLFINVLRYRHVNREDWEDGCLRRIDARTQENSDTQVVIGARGDRGFELRSTKAGEAVLPACVMSFAYWDPRILKQQRLLNAQTGEYTPIEVTPLGEDRITVQGEQMPAERYRIKAGTIVLDLWYSLGRQWLALESTLDSGSRLRYVAERTAAP